MTKIHFRPYIPNQTVLFPQRIDEDIAENDSVRMVDALVEGLNLESFRKLYKEMQPNSRTAKESSGVGRRDSNRYVLIPFAFRQSAASRANSGDILLESCAMATPFSCPFWEIM